MTRRDKNVKIQSTDLQSVSRDCGGVTDFWSSDAGSGSRRGTTGNSLCSSW